MAARNKITDLGIIDRTHLAELRRCYGIDGSRDKPGRVDIGEVVLQIEAKALNQVARYLDRSGLGEGVALAV